MCIVRETRMLLRVNLHYAPVSKSHCFWLPFGPTLGPNPSHGILYGNKCGAKKSGLTFVGESIRSDNPTPMISLDSLAKCNFL